MIAGIVLAAGASRRLGRPKQLLPLGGKPLLAWTLEALRASRPEQIVLVLGYRADEIAASVEQQGLTVVHNPRYAEGQSTSLQAGLAAVRADMEAVLVATCDQPLVTADLFAALAETWRRTGQPVVATAYGDHAGVPMLLARSAWPLVDTIAGDQGARAILRAHPELVARVAVPDPAMALDVDTEDDYSRLQSMLAPHMGSGDRPASDPAAGS